MTIIRKANKDDMPFIYSTWLKGQYYGHEWFSSMDRKTYYANYSKYLEALFAKNSTEITVLVLKDDPEVIIAYAVYTSPQALHWVFTKQAWRGKGHAAKLLLGSITTVKSITESGDAIARNKGWKFDPF